MISILFDKLKLFVRIRPFWSHRQPCQSPDFQSFRLNKSRAQRILWLLEEVEADYDIKLYHRENQLAPKELKEIHPLGKAPIISVEAEGMEKPLVLAESGPIVEYITDHFSPSLAPKQWVEGKEGNFGGETEKYLRYRYFMHYAEGLNPLYFHY